MRLPFFMPGIPVGREQAEIAALESLVADLRAYCRGEEPDGDRLAEAPGIAGWVPVEDTLSCRLADRVEGHPLVGPGVCTTSRVVAIGRSGRWMRSRTRL